MGLRPDENEGANLGSCRYFKGDEMNEIFESLMKSRTLVIDLDQPAKESAHILGTRRDFSLNIDGEQFQFVADIVSVKPTRSGSQILLKLVPLDQLN